MSMNIKRLNSADAGFDEALRAALAWDEQADAEVAGRVQAIIADVRARGDAALLEWTAKFDRLQAASASELVIPRERLQLALDGLPADQSRALREAADRIRDYHERQ